MRFIKLYKKNILIKTNNNLIYNSMFIYKLFFFLSYNNYYRHKIWNYKNVTKRN
jgi:hypothetical protein